MTREELQHRANEAKRLLNEPVFKQAMAELERDTVETLVSLPRWRGDRQRRALIERINVIRELRSQLDAYIRAAPADRGPSGIA